MESFHFYYVTPFFYHLTLNLDVGKLVFRVQKLGDPWRIKTKRSPTRTIGLTFYPTSRKPTYKTQRDKIYTYNCLDMRN